MSKTRPPRVHFAHPGMQIPLCSHELVVGTAFKRTFNRAEVTCRHCQHEINIYDFLRAGGKGGWPRRGTPPLEFRNFCRRRGDNRYKAEDERKEQRLVLHVNNDVASEGGG